MAELTQEDIFNDDKDPLEAISEIRKEEGNEPTEELESSLDVDTNGSAQAADDAADEDDLGELEPGEEPADINESQNGTDDTQDKDVDPEPKSANEPKSTDEEEEDDGEEVQEEEEAKAEVKSRTFKANGQEFSFTEEEILQQFETVFGQAMNYTQKMQKIAPYRKMISALEQEGLTHDQLNIAIDALKGDKGALAQIIKAHNIETMDLDEQDDSQPYQPTQYGKDETSLNIEEVSQRISADKEYPITVDIIGQQWDDTSRSAFANNPQLIVGLHNDVKSGKYDQVAPVAMKMKVLDGSGKSDIEYYMLAGEQLRQQEAQREQQQQQQKNAQQQTENLNQQTQAEVDKAEAASSVARRKRSASSTRTRADRQGVIDYLDDDDEKFDNWYNNLMSTT